MAPTKKAGKRAQDARKRARDARDKAQEKCQHPVSKQKFVGYATVCSPEKGGCGKVLR